MISYRGVDAGPLDGIRVLDLTNAWGDLAGRILADLGAYVLKIEPPGGTSSRRRPPFVDGRDGDPESSLYWASVGLGKRSAVLNLAKPRHAAKLTRLANVADVLIESETPGTMDALGLGHARLSALNPRLIYASLSPYGATGPKAHWPATELTLEAAGGRMALQGDRDRPPLPVGYPQAAFHGAAQLAADIVIALNEREQSGFGQWLDSSIQAAVAWTLLGAGAYPAAMNADPRSVRRAWDDPTDEQEDATRPFPRMVQTADGFAAIQMAPPDHSRMLTWIMAALAAEGALDKPLRTIDWDRWGQAYLDGQLEPEVVRRAVQRACGWFRRFTTDELVQWALDQDLRLGAINSTRDLLKTEQLRARDFWQEVGRVTHPGPPVVLSRTPMRLGGAAPRIGQHQSSVDEWLSNGTSDAIAVTPSGERSGEAFAGLLVVDFSWVAVGPTITRALGDHGAEVLKVESNTRLDLARRLAPYRDGVPGVNRSTWFSTYNTSKKSVTANLGLPEGRALARRLVDRADVVVESYSPGTMAKLGLDYATVSRGHEDLIMLSTSLMGQTGPFASYAGFGLQGAAFAGIHAITGWPDREPFGPFGPYTDVVAPKWGIAALGAAILERRRSGIGQHIDLSQIESGIRFIEPLVLDETVNGRTAMPAGLDSPTACPHRAYQTTDGHFVAIAVETAEQWRALRSVAPLAELSDPTLDCYAARRSRNDEIDAALSDWARRFERYELESVLIKAGVPASVVQWPTELHEDPQLVHREFYIALEHPEMSVTPAESFATRFSAKRVMLHGPAPLLGRDTYYALSEVLGMSDGEIAEHAAQGALE